MTCLIPRRVSLYRIMFTFSIHFERLCLYLTFLVVNYSQGVGVILSRSRIYFVGNSKLDFTIYFLRAILFFGVVGLMVIISYPMKLLKPWLFFHQVWLKNIEGCLGEVKVNHAY